MARSTISGLTVTIGADTQKFQNAIKEIDRVSKSVANDLKNVSQSLKMDPTAIQAYADKFKLLEEAVDVSAQKVKLAKDAIAALDKDLANGKVSPEEYAKAMDALKRQLESAEYEYERNVSALREYDKQTKESFDTIKEFAAEEEKAAESTDKLGDELDEFFDEADEFDHLFDNLSEFDEFAKNADEAGLSVLNLGDIIRANLISEAIISGIQLVGRAIRAIGEAAWNAAKALFNFTKESILISEESQQTLAKVGQVFKENAQQVVDWSQNAVDAMGLTKAEAQAAAATFGNMFAALDVTGVTVNNVNKNLADMSEDLVQLASDVAAFNNTSPEVVLEAFQSGLAGTSRQLREYGIVITAAGVEQKALELGLKATKDELTEGDKIVARYALMMEQAAHQSGQFARESGSITVQSAILRARVKELQDEIGDQLRPTIASIFKTINDFLASDAGKKIQNEIVAQFEKWAEIINGMIKDGSFEKFLNDLIDKLPTIADDIGELVGSALELIPQLAEIAGFILEIIGSVETMKNAKAWDEAEDKIEKFAEKYQMQTQTAKDAIAAFATENGLKLSEVLTNFSEYEPKIEQYMTDIGGEAGNMENSVRVALNNMPGYIQDGINEANDIDLSPLQSLAARVWEIVNNILSGVDYAGNAINAGPWQNHFDNGPHSSGGGKSFATGGWTAAGRLLQVNDDAGRRSEMFIPSVPGYILNGDQTDRIINNTNNSQTVGDVNIYLTSTGTDATAIANEIGIAVQKKLRMSGAMLY